MSGERWRVWGCFSVSQVHTSKESQLERASVHNSPATKGIRLSIQSDVVSFIGVFAHIPTDLVVAREDSDVESSSHRHFLWLYNMRRHFVA